MNQRQRERAIEVLRTNDRGRHTVPSGRLYPHQWAWDSAFAAIGWSLLDCSRALDELELLFEGQWDDGRVPHIAFDSAASNYFPGPDFWECSSTSSITNPPVWATALRVIGERGGDRNRIAALVPKVEASLQFFAQARDPLGWGGVAVVHPWESGRDNCPAWDRALEAVDPSEAPSFERVDLSMVESPEERPTEDQYKRYAVLVKAIAADDFGPGPFAVYDPFMTAVLVRADRDLRHVASTVGVPVGDEDREARAQSCLKRLWSADERRFGFFDVRGERRETPEVLAAYLAATVVDDQTISAAALEALELRYRSSYRLPTVAPEDSSFEPVRYWRGPIWISMNWLFATAGDQPFHAELAASTIRLVAESDSWEYFDPRSGKGLGADCFTWSAALALDLDARRG